VQAWIAGRVVPDQSKLWALLHESNARSTSCRLCEDKAGSAEISTAASEQEQESLASSPRISEHSGGLACPAQAVPAFEDGLDLRRALRGEAVQEQHPTLHSHGAQMSIGSELHEAGACTPCAFYCFKKQGCGQGAECGFCHMPHMSNKKMRMQEWRKKQQPKQKPRRAGQLMDSDDFYSPQAQKPAMATEGSAYARQATAVAPYSASQTEQPSLAPWVTTQRLPRQASFASTASPASISVASSALSSGASALTSPTVPPVARGQSFSSGALGEPCFISISPSGCRCVSFSG